MEVLLSHLLQRLTLVQLLDALLEIFKPKDQHRDVVEGAACGGLAQSNFNSLSRCNMLIVVKLLLGSLAAHLAFVGASVDGAVG